MEMDPPARADVELANQISVAVAELNVLLRQAAERQLYAQVDLTDEDLADDEPPARVVEVRLQKAGI